MAKSKYTLGIYVGHDSSVSLVNNGKIVASAAEERFTGLKHYSSLPVRALKFCLKQENISIEDLSAIVIPTIGLQENIEVLLGRLKQGIVKKEVDKATKNSLDYLRYFMICIFRLLNIWTPLVPPSYIKTYQYPLNKPLVYIEHHLAHAAAAYFTSGFKEKTLVVAADGSGDGLSTTIWIGQNGKLTPLLKVGREGSFGAFYGLITEALGWQVGDGESKVMALAAFGNSKKTKGVLDEFAPHYENGKLKKGYNWGFPGIWEEMGSSHFHFADTPKIVKLIKKYGRENIAADAQRIVEEQLTGLLKSWIEKENIKLLAATGGVFLNVKANQRIWELGLLKDYYIFPDVGESGVASGAALYEYFKDMDEIGSAISNMNLGPAYTNKEIEEILKIRKIKYEYLENQDLIKKSAGLIFDNSVIGWFQGRMEAGPRALGNRTILMSPKKTGNKDIINKFVKFREDFYPLCCSTIDQAADKYFGNLPPSASSMLISTMLNENERINLQAATHIDGTVCPQVLKRKENPMFYDLIREFGQLSGTPVLLSTSFNISGKPVVRSPVEAIQCFYNSGLDYLVLGNYLISK